MSIVAAPLASLPPSSPSPPKMNIPPPMSAMAPIPASSIFWRCAICELRLRRPLSRASGEPGRDLFSASFCVASAISRALPWQRQGRHWSLHRERVHRGHRQRRARLRHPRARSKRKALLAEVATRKRCPVSSSPWYSATSWTSIPPVRRGAESSARAVKPGRTASLAIASIRRIAASSGPVSVSHSVAAAFASAGLLMKSWVASSPPRRQANL